MQATGIEDRYRLLSAQEGLVYNNLRGPGVGVDVIQVTVEWPEPLDRTGWEEAWRRAIARHPALRTAFCFEPCDEPLQEPNGAEDADQHREAYRRGFAVAERVLSGAML